MAEPFNRFRSRVTPRKLKSGNQKLGGYFPMTTQGGVPTGIWSPTEISPQFFNYQAPYQNLESISDQKGHKGPPFYEGGPLKHLRATYTDPYDGVHGRGTYLRSDGLMKYVGGFAPPVSTWFGGPNFDNKADFLIPNSPYFFDLSAYGHRAWNKCKPKIEYADAYVFLKELRDVKRMVQSTGKLMQDSYDRTLRSALAQNLPTSGAGLVSRHFQRRLRSSVRNRMMSPRYVADQFLNEQFGWLPFLSDIRKFNSAIEHFIEINARITERNGRWKRRKVTVVEDEVVTRVNKGNGQILDPILGTHWSHYFSTEPSWEVVEITNLEIYAVGSWRFYLREFDMGEDFSKSEWARMMRQLDIFGARISPINIYKAIPWTWANDWLNSSSVWLEYLSDSIMNDLACKYFYLMGHQIVTRKLIVTLPFYSGTKVLTFSREIETKQRLEAASPFDFDLQWNMLTPRQLAIAAALYITRR